MNISISILFSHYISCSVTLVSCIVVAKPNFSSLTIFFFLTWLRNAVTLSLSWDSCLFFQQSHSPVCWQSKLCRGTEWIFNGVTWGLEQTRMGTISTNTASVTSMLFHTVWWLRKRILEYITEKYYTLNSR